MPLFLGFFSLVLFTILFGMLSFFILVKCINIAAKTIVVIAILLLLIFWYGLMKGFVDDADEIE